jgi:arylsulfatase A-like enzyme
MNVALASESRCCAHESHAPQTARSVVGPCGVLLLSVWCGLATGVLEVGAIILKTHLGTDRILHFTRHFVWMIPLADLILLSGLGAVLALLTKIWTRWGGWLSVRALFALTFVPALLVLFPALHPGAVSLVSLGIAARFAAVIARDPDRFRPYFRKGFALSSIVLALLPAWVFGGDALAAWRESSRPLPPEGSPNVLLIVLDTVRADHLSAYGYARPTTPNLERFAGQCIRFDAAHSTAPWTLPSHGSMFTGRWPHELGVGWFTPLDRTYPTLADYLGSQGYATGGFVGNLFYCAHGSGLERGFTRYEDHIISFKRLKMSKLCSFGLQCSVLLGSVLRDSFNIDLLGPLARLLFASPNPPPNQLNRGLKSRPATSATLDPRNFIDTSSLEDEHRSKDASDVNREFLAWLRSADRRRPFFAFLNYIDAHHNYVIPWHFDWRFGEKPRTSKDFQIISNWYSEDKKKLSERELGLGRDAYDNCIAYLDEQLGELIGKLADLGVLDDTLVIITGDHGESFGEHGFFTHPCSLYEGEVHVPLFIRPSKRPRTSGVVHEPVSLRDLAATVVDVIGMGESSPFPGRSLSRYWEHTTAKPVSREAEGVLSEVYAPVSDNPDRAILPAASGPVLSLADGNYVYILQLKNFVEELYDIHQDPGETRNLAEDPAMRATLGRLRQRLIRLVGDIKSPWKRL